VKRCGLSVVKSGRTRGRGLLVCIEGLDKSGKTTHSRLLVKDLNEMGYDAVYTREPSLGEVGRLIRKIILHGWRRAPPVLEAVLFAADRFDHVEKEIKPALEEGKIVVSDRYLYSSLAYQGASGLDLDWIMEINRFALPPDLAIYIDVPVEVLAKRMGEKRSVMEWPRIQSEVRKVYLKLVEKGFLVPVDGNRPVEEVSREILSLVLERLKGKGRLRV